MNQLFGTIFSICVFVFLIYYVSYALSVYINGPNTQIEITFNVTKQTFVTNLRTVDSMQSRQSNTKLSVLQ